MFSKTPTPRKAVTDSEQHALPFAAGLAGRVHGQGSKESSASRKTVSAVPYATTEEKHELETTGAADEGEDGLVRAGSE